MRNRWMIVVGSLFMTIMVLALMGCAKPPQAELDAAQSALSEASAAEAQEYAAAEWQKAEATLHSARNEIDAQASRFALVRNYEEANKLLARASEEARQAQGAAVAGKELARQEAQTARDEAQQVVEQARNLIEELEGCGRGVKGFSTDMAALRGSLDGLAAEMPAIETALAEEDFSGATSRSSALESHAATLVNDLETAKLKLKCRPKA